MITAVAAARSLAPLIRACRDEIERTRRLPAPLVAAMAEAGLFRMYVPRTLGGLEVDPVTLLGAVEAVAQIDGAVGWSLAIGAVHGALGAYLREDVARAIYCDDPRAVVAGSAKTPTGSQNLLRDRPSVQSDIARAEALVRSARAFLVEALQDIWEALLRDGEVTMRQRAMGRIAGVHAATQHIAVTATYYELSGRVLLGMSPGTPRF